MSTQFMYKAHIYAQEVKSDIIHHIGSVIMTVHIIVKQLCIYSIYMSTGYFTAILTVVTRIYYHYMTAVDIIFTVNRGRK